MSPNANSVELERLKERYERMLDLLKRNENWDFETFIQLLNRYRKAFRLELDIEMLSELCKRYCSDIFVINYKNRKVVVVGDTIIGIVYYCQTDKKVKSLDRDEYDENEIMELI